MSISTQAKKSQKQSTIGLKVEEPPTLWPEWSDAEINAVKWGNPIGLSKVTKGGKPDSAISSKGDKSITSKATGVVEEVFEDKYEVPLPSSLKTGDISWVKPSIILNETIKLVVYSSTAPTLPDLLTKNREIFNSTLIRAIVSAVSMLTYLGQTRPFAVEWQTPIYLANTESQPWKPWHHIYSIGRAGKGQVHNPIANTLGKYAVRLYWLGCWRKLIVDDKCPVDESGKFLFPVSNIPNDKEFELWPLLLFKALMKIASLTWYEHKEIVDFDVVTCLTGWPVQKVFTTGMDSIDIWEMICGYSDNYTWDQRLVLGPSEEEPDALGAMLSAKTESAAGSKKSADGSKSSKGAPVVSNEGRTGYHLTATCLDLRSLGENAIEDITPCYSHEFLIEETRTIPLVDTIPNYDRNISKWKEFRWVDWAVKHGKWDRVYDWEIFKCMSMVSAFRKADEYVIYDAETSEHEKFIKHSVEIIDEFVEMKEIEKLGPGKGKDKGKKEDKGPKKGVKEVFVNPSIWSDFTKLAQYITCVSIYLKPSMFRVNYIISDFPFNAAPDPKLKKPPPKKEEKKKPTEQVSIRYLLWEHVLMKSRNDAIYLFTDSIDLKLIMFSLTHLGNELPKNVAAPDIDNLSSACKKLVCTRKKCQNGCICQNTTSDETIPEEGPDTRKYAHIIVEDYDWKSLSIGETAMFLKTCGNKSVLMNLEKGRHVKRIWVESESPFSLLIFCDTEIKVGKIDEILDEMVEESEIVTEKCYDMCSSFGRLLQFFGFPEYKLALKLFYKSYMPAVNLSKKQMSLIHESFQQELIKVLAECFPPEKHYELSRAFRILLLNPTFRIPYAFEKKLTVEPKNIECPECPCVDIDTIKLRECAAIKLQSYFKMIYMKKLKQLQDPTDKRFQPVMDLLKQVYLNIFSTKVRNININLLRCFAFNPNIQNVIQYFPYYEDLNSVIVLKQFAGEIIDVPEYSWVPIVRRVFYCNTSDSILVRAYVFCKLENYVLRIINNDTGKETDRHTHTALVSKYEKNEKGYTVLAYGWTYENPIKLLSWKLYVVIDKILNTCPVVCEPVNNLVTCLKGNYIPNKDNLICKYIIKVQESCLGTFHFQSSYPAAKLKIQCTNQCDEILYEASGTGTVLVPVVCLYKKEESASLNDSKVSMKFFLSPSNSKRLTKSKFGSSSKKRASRNSLERRSIGSGGSKTQRKSSLTLGENSLIEFYMKVYVGENSWPLVRTEWELVEKLRRRGSIEHELNLSGNTATNLEGSKKSESLSKKSITRKSKDQFIATPGDEKQCWTPYWVLTSLCDAENNLTVEIDERRFEELKTIKRNLFENDTQRFLFGLELRNEFLEDHWIQWSQHSNYNFVTLIDTEDEHTSFDTGDYRSVSMAVGRPESVDVPFLLVKKMLWSKENFNLEKNDLCPECNKSIPSAQISFLRCPESVDKMLPPFDVNKFNEEEDRYRWVILPEQEEKIFTSIIENIENFYETQNKFENNMTAHLKQMKSTNEYLWQWFDGIRESSTEMMVRSELRRQAMIDQIYSDRKKLKK